MATNATEILREPRLEEEVFRLQKVDSQSNVRPAVENKVGITGEEHRIPADRGGLREAGQDFVLAPLVDKIAQGLARVLVVAVQELEAHIASETRKVGDSVGRRLDTLQASFHDLSEVVSEQRAMSRSVQDKCEQLSATAASLQEADARHEAEVSALRSESKEFSTAISQRVDVLCKELGVQQEDLAAVKSTLCDFSSRVDAVVERLDRQADALRSMYSTYAQRETELEQLMDGLARLRAYPAPAPVARL